MNLLEIFRGKEVIVTTMKFSLSGFVVDEDSEFIKLEIPNHSSRFINCAHIIEIYEREKIKY